MSGFDRVTELKKLVEQERIDKKVAIEALGSLVKENKARVCLSELDVLCQKLKEAQNKEKELKKEFSKLSLKDVENIYLEYLI